jgi:hypothetical protein
VTEALNAQGDVVADALARGGHGRDDSRGGDAQARVQATAEGDGSVAIGAPFEGFSIPFGTTFGAFGGSASGESRGGSATSESVGRALGSGEVAVWDAAKGGSGNAGHGGNATSSATGWAGAARVSAHAIAGGGAGPRGGEAAATSFAAGLGEVLAESRARGGPGDVLGGRALAEATASGESGWARSEASASGAAFRGFLTSGGVSAVAEAPVASTVRAVAAAADRTPLDDLVSDPAESFAYAVASPRRGDVAALAERNPLLAEAFQAARIGPILAQALVGGTDLDGAADDSILLRSEFRLASGLPDIEGPGLLGFADVELDPATFGVLHLLVSEGDALELSTLIDVTFTDAREALTFFTTQVLPLEDLSQAPFLLPSRVLQVELAFGASQPGGSFQVGFLVGAVPEPGAAWFLLVAVLGVGLRRGRWSRHTQAL